MKKLDVFVTSAEDSTSLQSPIIRRDMRKEMLSLKKQFQDERRRLIDALFSHLHYNRAKELPMRTMAVDFPLYRGIGPSRAVRIQCMYILVYDQLAKSLPHTADRLHAALSTHTLVAVTLSDLDSDREDKLIPLRQQNVEHRIETAFGREVRQHFDSLFDSRPKPSPFLIPVNSERAKAKIVDYMHNSRRVRTQCSQAGFRNIEADHQRGVLLMR